MGVDDVGDCDFCAAAQKYCMPNAAVRLDDIDVRLLEELQTDADRTLRELGDCVGLSPSAVQRRMQKHKQAGLTRTVVQIVPDKTPGLTQALILLALVHESPEHHARLSATLRDHPAVQQCYLLSGRWDYAVVVSAGTVRELRDLSARLFQADDNVRRYDTMFVLDAVKSGTRLPSQCLT